MPNKPDEIACVECRRRLTTEEVVVRRKGETWLWCYQCTVAVIRSMGKESWRQIEDLLLEGVVRV